MILTNFDKFVEFIKIQAEGSFWKTFKKSQEKFERNLKNCLKNFKEILYKFIKIC